MVARVLIIIFAVKVIRPVFVVLGDFAAECRLCAAVLTPMFLQRVSIACYAKRCISYRKSVRRSVCPSVRRWHCVKTTQATIMGSSL